MANFVLLYTGGSAGSTPAEREKIMGAWGAWFGQLGDKVVDVGGRLIRLVHGGDGSKQEP